MLAGRVYRYWQGIIQFFFFLINSHWFNVLKWSELNPQLIIMKNDVVQSNCNNVKFRFMFKFRNVCFRWVDSYNKICSKCMFCISVCS